MPRSIDITSVAELMGGPSLPAADPSALRNHGSFRVFHNMLRILTSIDRPEFEDCLNYEDIQHFSSADPKWIDKQWEAFRDKPHHYFIQCCDFTAERLFEIVMKRSIR